ncbi:hypothetical protein M113_0329 [Bacteroides fragilis str. 3986 N3]|uniref:Uncharacterized protein n=1 Tax=Bacteroides fragilis str. 3976T8 TaxID=1339314 RepID=A0A016AV70_BACFG|nr:hypothetical protein HMPREF0101_02296 [Bacteroides fragilis]EXZ75325.1 hypothetical protein M123_0348 [Bacteroides fragilis str. 3976T8]EYE70675.1 hypothetical protein M113_0329 [Bacteroides fragilis str. 3986 N3]RGZ87589.1 hypothetical protein DW968_01700 [Bacteroides fragilis]RHF28343.1 hypothetical protein DW695_06805 [Bacteroides fragilis]
MVWIPVYYVLFRNLYLVPRTWAAVPEYVDSWAQAPGLMGPGIQDEVKIALFPTN